LYQIEKVGQNEKLKCNFSKAKRTVVYNRDYSFLLSQNLKTMAPSIYGTLFIIIHLEKVMNSRLIAFQFVVTALVGCGMGKTNDSAPSFDSNTISTNMNWTLAESDGQAAFLIGTSQDIIVQERPFVTGAVFREFKLTIDDTSSQTTSLRTMALDTGNIYTGFSPWIVRANSKNDGKLLWTEQSGYDCSHVVDMAVDTSSIYIGGNTGSACNSGAGYYDIQWRLEKRDLTTGALQWEVFFEEDVSNKCFDCRLGLVNNRLYFASQGNVVLELAKTDGSALTRSSFTLSSRGRIFFDASSIFFLTQPTDNSSQEFLRYILE
jgi:hypothetical protein